MPATALPTLNPVPNLAAAHTVAPGTPFTPPKAPDPAAFGRELGRARARAAAAEDTKHPAPAEPLAPTANVPAKDMRPNASERKPAAGEPGAPRAGGQAERARQPEPSGDHADAAAADARPGARGDAAAAVTSPPAGTMPAAPLPAVALPNATEPASAVLAAPEPAGAEDLAAAPGRAFPGATGDNAAQRTPWQGTRHRPSGPGPGSAVAATPSGQPGAEHSATDAASAAAPRTPAAPASEAQAQLPNANAAAPAWAQALERALNPAGAAAPVQADVSATPGSREFAPALGAQLAVFLRGGIQQAELTLHPAELGPIAVSIVLNGTVAQIDFQAVNAFTRDALQQALPALASALQDAGFSLGGCDVSDPGQRPAEPGGGGQHGGQGHQGDRHAPGAAPEWREGAGAAPRAARRGVLDLYA